jgi:hypothetical protein
MHTHELMTIHAVTVAILAQGTSLADAAKQAFLKFGLMFTVDMRNLIGVLLWLFCLCSSSPVFLPENYWN